MKIGKVLLNLMHKGSILELMTNYNTMYRDVYDFPCIHFTEPHEDVLTAYITDLSFWITPLTIYVRITNLPPNTAELEYVSLNFEHLHSIARKINETASTLFRDLEIDVNNVLYNISSLLSNMFKYWLTIDFIIINNDMAKECHKTHQHVELKSNGHVMKSLTGIFHGHGLSYFLRPLVTRYMDSGYALFKINVERGEIFDIACSGEYGISLAVDDGVNTYYMYEVDNKFRGSRSLKPVMHSMFKLLSVANNYIDKLLYYVITLQI